MGVTTQFTRLTRQLRDDGIEPDWGLVLFLGVSGDVRDRLWLSAKRSPSDIVSDWAEDSLGEDQHLIPERVEFVTRVQRWLREDPTRPFDLMSAKDRRTLAGFAADARQLGATLCPWMRGESNEGILRPDLLAATFTPEMLTHLECFSEDHEPVSPGSDVYRKNVVRRDVVH